jgi:hypothetical protein
MTSHLEQAEWCLQELSLRAATLSTDQLIALTTAHATLALSEVPEGLDADRVAGWLGSLDADQLERAALEREDAYLGGTRAILAQLQDYLRAVASDA